MKNKLAAAVVSALAPLVALACPVCAQDRTSHAVLIVGAMISAPYVVAALVIRAIRAGEEER